METQDKEVRKLNPKQERVKLAEAAIRVPCTPETFIRKWFEFLTPVHKLTTREIDVAVAFVEEHLRLRKLIQDDKILNQHLFSVATKKAIGEKLNITPVYFRRIMPRLCQAGIIRNKSINPKYIPDYNTGKPFRLMIIIDDAATLRRNTE